MNDRQERLQALASRIELELDFLDQCLSAGALRTDEATQDPLEVSPSEAARLRRLQRLCRGLEIDVFSGAIIVGLLERLEELERDLELLRRP